MLRISKLADYGTMVAAHMALAPEALHSAPDIAKALHLGPPTVAKILKCLVRHQLVASQRGVNGGYALTRPAGQISLSAVIDAIENQSFGLTECSSKEGFCAHESACRIRANWQRINRTIRDALDQATVADLIAPTAEAQPLRACMPQGRSS